MRHCVNSVEVWRLKSKLQTLHWKIQPSNGAEMQVYWFMYWVQRNRQYECRWNDSASDVFTRKGFRFCTWCRGLCSRGPGAGTQSSQDHQPDFWKHRHVTELAQSQLYCSARINQIPDGVMCPNIYQVRLRKILWGDMYILGIQNAAQQKNRHEAHVSIPSRTTSCTCTHTLYKCIVATQSVRIKK